MFKNFDEEIEEINKLYSPISKFPKHVPTFIRTNSKPLNENNSDNENKDRKKERKESLDLKSLNLEEDNSFNSKLADDDVFIVKSESEKDGMNN